MRVVGAQVLHLAAALYFTQGAFSAPDGASALASLNARQDELEEEIELDADPESGDSIYGARRRSAAPAPADVLAPVSGGAAVKNPRAEHAVPLKTGGFGDANAVLPADLERREGEIDRSCQGKHCPHPVGGGWHGRFGG